MYQQITIVGNVGRDAALKYTSTGIAVADFSVAVSKVTGSGDTKTEKTIWFKVTVWRAQAETAEKYVKKGMKILVTGEVDYSTWVDKTSGETKVSLEVTAHDMKFLSSRADMETRAPGDSSEASERPSTPKASALPPHDRKKRDAPEEEFPF